MVEIKEERLSSAEYIDFLKRTDLGSQYPRERFAERIERLLRNASISLAARNEEKCLLGVLLGLTDFAYWLYVTDLGVDRNYERQGIGRRLIKEALTLAGGEKDIAVYLIANENAVPFYGKLGMKKSDDVMQYNHIEWTEFTVGKDQLFENISTIPDNIVIQRETEVDHPIVENLIRESFWNVYRPGCYEHYVIHCLRNDPAFVPELDFVMEKDGQIIGQNMFMRAVIQADDGREIPIMTMGPICIAPEYKRQGYGKILLDYSLERAKELGCGALCFEGNIQFYGKCGFTYAREFGIRYHDLPEDADDTFFLCQELIPGYLSGITGVYEPPHGYFCATDNPEAFEAFDEQFPPKVKLKLPGQLE